jgi:hypothetical protein
LRNICEQVLYRRGIVYPKWTKITKPNGTQSWTIEKFVFTFSKHIANPSKIYLKTLGEKNEFSAHVQYCPYKVIKHLIERFSYNVVYQSAEEREKVNDKTSTEQPLTHNI